jgi:phosphatidylserine/phosphatidylglycerophosphate/cardiolipin synthase-like enzyme
MKDSRDAVQLVVSAPSEHVVTLTYRAQCRTTLGALTQLIASARKTLVLAAPFLQAEQGLARGPMSEAVQAALRRGVEVQVLSTGKGLEAIDYRSLSEAAGHLTLLRPRPNLENERALGAHAKLCAADWETAYIGSANFTGPGLSYQVEIGVLVSGPVVRQLQAFWTYCLEEELFVKTSG